MINGEHRRDHGILDHGEAFPHALPCDFQHRLHREIAGLARGLQMSVHADAVPAFAAEHLIYGHMVILALDIPQRLFDAADGAHLHRPAAVKGAPVHQLPQGLDPSRILTDQHGFQLADRGFHGARVPFEDGFSPAADALVRADFQKLPARGDVKQIKTRDFHGSKPPDVPDHGRDVCAVSGIQA